MGYQQLDNPKGAFGYNFGDGDDLRQHQEVRRFHNASSANGIRSGDAVCLSSLSPDGLGVVTSTLSANPLFVGVAQSSASTAQSTVASSAAPAGSWVDVVVSGPSVYNGIQGESPGDIVAVLEGTGAGSTLGHLGALVATGTAGSIRIAGVVITSATTGTSGFLSTVVPKGIVNLDPSFALRTSV